MLKVKLIELRITNKERNMDVIFLKDFKLKVSELQIYSFFPIIAQIQVSLGL